MGSKSSRVLQRLTDDEKRLIGCEMCWARARASADGRLSSRRRQEGNERSEVTGGMAQSPKAGGSCWVCDRAAQSFDRLFYERRQCQ